MTFPDHPTQPTNPATEHTPDQYRSCVQQPHDASSGENPTATTPQPVTVRVGDTVWVRLPHSEVCLRLRLAGAVRRVVVLERTALILDDEYAWPYCAPILHGEAGIHTHPGTGALHTYPAAPRACPRRGHRPTHQPHHRR